MQRLRRSYDVTLGWDRLKMIGSRMLQIHAIVQGDGAAQSLELPAAASRGLLLETVPPRYFKIRAARLIRNWAARCVGEGGAL